ncbi:MAG: signal peptidase II [Candidatus Latescibacteria bacterium]|nr:signal peptidase II [Candidatus Latescibacterota bacterium]
MHKRLWLFVLFIVALISDQISKIAVDSAFSLYESKEIIGSYLKLTYIRNSGAAFGLSFGNSKVMFVVSVLVIVMLAFLFFKGQLRTEHFAGRAAVVLVFSGAFGNMMDRIRLGEVIDFIDMGLKQHRWPIYNFADIYVTIGMIILFFTYAFTTEKTEKIKTSLPD